MMKQPFKIVTITVLMVLMLGCQPEKERSVAVQSADELGLLESGPGRDSQKEPIQKVEAEQAEPGQPESAEAKDEQVELTHAGEPLGPEPQEDESREAQGHETKAEEAQGQEQEPKPVEVHDEEEPQSKEGAEREISHERPAFYKACELIFSTYVDEQGLVDYNELRRKRAQLINAAREYNKVHPGQVMSWTDNEKIAFWINAHNIFTLKLVIDNYPIQPRWFLINYPDNSIMHIPGGRNKTYFKVMGMEYTLREIEREVLMERFGGPRICFALSYASMGGAFLRNEPYYPEKLDKQLDEQVTRYLSSPRGFRLDIGSKTIFLSDIFNWYKKVFIAKYGSVKKFRNRQPHIQSYLNFIAEYVSPENAGYFELDNYKVEFQLYDWHLNEQPLGD